MPLLIWALDVNDTTCRRRHCHRMVAKGEKDQRLVGAVGNRAPAILRSPKPYGSGSEDPSSDRPRSCASGADVRFSNASNVCGPGAGPPGFSDLAPRPVPAAFDPALRLTALVLWRLCALPRSTSSAAPCALEP